MTGSASGGSGSSGSRAVSTSASSSSTATACAACKYQRRKCTPECPLSPYFPPDQPKRFQNVHKLFGVSNILRILKHVDPSKREDTVKSISYEADTREKDPVHGCLGVITILQNQVSKLKDELAVAREQLFLLQQQHNFNQQAQMQQIVSSLGGNTSIVTVSSAGHETNNVLMQNYPSYNDMTSNALPVSSFEPDQYLRTDGYDQMNNNNNNNNKPGGGGGASSSRFDVGRYMREESPLHHHQAVKEESGAALHHYQHYESTTTGTTTPFGNHQQDHREQVFNDPFAMAMRRRGGGGPLNLTVASEADFRLAAGGGGGGTGGELELRSAGVYLTLTN